MEIGWHTGGTHRYLALVLAFQVLVAVYKIKSAAKRSKFPTK